MRSDKDMFTNNEYLIFVKNCFNDFLGEKIKLLQEEYSNDTTGMGAFVLTYLFVLNNYTISFEYQKIYFDIHIKNNKGGDISLCEACQFILNCDYGWKWSDWTLEKENIKNAIYQLSVLLELDAKSLYFYIYKNGKIYRDENGVLKRLKKPLERRVHLE